MHGETIKFKNVSIHLYHPQGVAKLNFGKLCSFYIIKISLKTSN